MVNGKVVSTHETIVEAIKARNELQAEKGSPSITFRAVSR
jgi:hypothetical protein